jgi:3-isopropylmalate/(R)-2-methylmalate dehydratase small subunit
VLNQPVYQGASILVAGPDFGTGSSREHAVWALARLRLQRRAEPKFADIFRGNAGKQGLLSLESFSEAISNASGRRSSLIPASA